MSALPHSFSVIMPVYNEAATLDAGVRAVLAYFDGLNIPFEIIIIESGSSDDTGAKADEIARERPEVHVLHEGRRNGFGSAVRLGYQHAVMRWGWLITPDLPFPLRSLEEAIPLLDRYDAVLSYRAADNRSQYRKLQSVCFNRLVRTLFHVKARSINSAFKLLPVDLVRELHIRSRGWTIDAEIICILERRGVRYAEIGVPLHDRVAGASKIGFRTALRVVRELLELWRWRESIGIKYSHDEVTGQKRSLSVAKKD